MPQCVVCQQPRNGRILCPDCKQSYYCSTQCLRKDADVYIHANVCPGKKKLAKKLVDAENGMINALTERSLVRHLDEEQFSLETRAALDTNHETVFQDYIAVVAPQMDRVRNVMANLPALTTQALKSVAQGKEQKAFVESVQRGGYSTDVLTMLLGQLDAQKSVFSKLDERQSAAEQRAILLREHGRMLFLRHLVEDQTKINNNDDDDDAEDDEDLTWVRTHMPALFMTTDDDTLLDNISNMSVALACASELADCYLRDAKVRDLMDEMGVEAPLRELSASQSQPASTVTVEEDTSARMHTTASSGGSAAGRRKSLSGPSNMYYIQQKGARAIEGRTNAADGDDEENDENWASCFKQLGLAWRNATSSIAVKVFKMIWIIVKNMAVGVSNLVKRALSWITRETLSGELVTNMIESIATLFITSTIRNDKVLREKIAAYDRSTIEDKLRLDVEIERRVKRLGTWTWPITIAANLTIYGIMTVMMVSTGAAVLDFGHSRFNGTNPSAISPEVIVENVFANTSMSQYLAISGIINTGRYNDPLNSKGDIDTNAATVIQAGAAAVYGALGRAGVRNPFNYVIELRRTGEKRVWTDMATEKLEEYSPVALGKPYTNAGGALAELFMLLVPMMTEISEYESTRNLILVNTAFPPTPPVSEKPALTNVAVKAIALYMFYRFWKRIFFRIMTMPLDFFLRSTKAKRKSFWYRFNDRPPSFAAAVGDRLRALVGASSGESMVGSMTLSTAEESLDNVVRATVRRTSNAMEFYAAVIFTAAVVYYFEADIRAAGDGFANTSGQMVSMALTGLAPSMRRFAHMSNYVTPDNLFNVGIYELLEMFGLSNQSLIFSSLQKALAATLKDMNVDIGDKIGKAAAIITSVTTMATAEALRTISGFFVRKDKANDDAAAAAALRNNDKDKFIMQQRARNAGATIGNLIVVLFVVGMSFVYVWKSTATTVVVNTPF